ncbi:MAG: cyclic nucleotide-binding domain-containing protein [Acidimicrobiia bacterium]|nr:cyclic nucleotide-binding domain-containing protein [Acidimicrobiia bacterium]
MDRVEALKTSALLRALDDSQLESLAGIAKERTLNTGDVLIRAGDTGALAMYIILEGKVEVSRRGTPLSIMGPGQHIGEMALLAPEDTPRSADVKVIEPTRVLQLASWDLFPFLDINPAVARAIITELARRLVMADERLVQILSGEA